MKKVNAIWEKDGYILRPAQKEDAESYYQNNYNPLDPEVAYLTGCKSSFTHDEVVDFFLSCIDDGKRYDFLIIFPDGKIIGESVINEINWELRSANFRIGIFHSDICGKGIGSWTTRMTCRFAFEQLHLHRLELDVFSFNLRAEKAKYYGIPPLIFKKFSLLFYAYLFTPAIFSAAAWVVPVCEKQITNALILKSLSTFRAVFKLLLRPKSTVTASFESAFVPCLHPC